MKIQEKCRSLVAARIKKIRALPKQLRALSSKLTVIV